MKILHVVQSLEVGGLEVVVAALARQQLRAGLQPAICCVERPGALADGLKADGIEVYCLDKPPGVSLSAVRSLRGLIRSGGFDIVHTHNPMGHFYGAFAALGRRPPVIHTRHQMSRPQNWRQRLRSRLSARLSARLVGVSGAVTQIMLDEFSIPADKAVTIHNGIDTNPFMDLEPPPDHAAKVIGTIGRLTPVKDQRLLVAVFASLAKDFPRLTLRIVGDGECMDDLQQQVSELGLSSRVTFCGYRSDVAHQMKQIDIFVICSVTEGMPIVLIEAMAGCRPIVATSVGGIPEMIRHKETGLLVPPENPERLQAAIRTLLLEPESGRRMGRAARGHAAAHFDIESMCNRYLAEYRELL